jgi:ribonuclease HII
VIRAAACVSVAVRSVRAIDTRGLHVSNIAALSDCMRGVASEPDDVARLVDGFRLPSCELEHERVVDGDARSAAIAAASVVAKVTRDRLMDRYHRRYPQYGFRVNRGYGTPGHRAAIARYGPSPIHRMSFRGLKLWAEDAAAYWALYADLERTEGPEDAADEPGGLPGRGP